MLDRVVEGQLQTKMAKLSSASVALLIFVRHPEIGKVKTRLAKVIGDEKALEVYTELLSHTLKITKSIDATKFVFYTEEVQKNDLWNEPGYFKCKQKGKDLGDRMKEAFSFVFQQRFKKVIIVGSDCYQLTSKIIEDTISLLSSNEMILGPAMDGGYYLLGMTKLYPEFFVGKSWSTSKVATETIDDAKRLGLKFSLLETLSDIDEFEDLATSGFKFD